MFIVSYFMLFCRPGTQNNLPFNLNAKPNLNYTKKFVTVYPTDSDEGKIVGFRQHSNSNSVAPVITHNSHCQSRYLSLMLAIHYIFIMKSYTRYTIKRK